MTIGLATIIRNERNLIDLFVSSNEIFRLFHQVVFVDDFSTDGTYEYIYQMFASGKNGKHRNDIIVRRHLNYDFGSQRNYATSFLDTDYVSVLDVDMQLNSAAKDYIRLFAGNKDYYRMIRHEVVDNKLVEIFPEQTILFKNIPTIFFEGIIHEPLVGYETLEYLPGACIMYHTKDTKRCYRQGEFYANFDKNRQVMMEANNGT